MAVSMPKFMLTMVACRGNFDREVLVLPSVQDRGKGTQRAFGDDSDQAILNHHAVLADSRQGSHGLNLRVECPVCRTGCADV
jgi:hypothetical protein